jgi:hypothetical protein
MTILLNSVLNCLSKKKKERFIPTKLKEKKMKPAPNFYITLFQIRGKCDQIIPEND